MYKSLVVFAFIFLMSACSKDKEVVEPAEAQFEYVGNWLGNWSDNLFQNIPVSVKVRETSTNAYLGDFFINNSGNAAYTPAYGTINDGRITFETKGDSVLNFVYLQDAPTYKNGCPGTYKGSGIINRTLNRLVIDFTGNDCDGFHEDGKMIFELDD